MLLTYISAHTQAMNNGVGQTQEHLRSHQTHCTGISQVSSQTISNITLNRSPEQHCKQH